MFDVNDPRPFFLNERHELQPRKKNLLDDRRLKKADLQENLVDETSRADKNWEELCKEREKSKHLQEELNAAIENAKTQARDLKKSGDESLNARAENSLLRSEVSKLEAELYHSKVLLDQITQQTSLLLEEERRTSEFWRTKMLEGAAIKIAQDSSRAKTDPLFEILWRASLSPKGKPNQADKEKLSKLGLSLSSLREKAKEYGFEIRVSGPDDRPLIETVEPTQ